MQPPALEALVSPKYTTHRAGALFFGEAIQWMGGKLVNWSKVDPRERFSVTFACDRRLAEKIQAAGVFDVSVQPDGNYELSLARYELGFWTKNGRAATADERQEVLRRLCADWKNKFRLRTHLSSAELAQELIGAASAGDYDAVKCVMEAGQGSMAIAALLYGAQAGEEIIVELALEHGADINFGEGVALLMAVTSGHCGLIQFLLSKGANPLLPSGRSTIFESCQAPEVLAMMLNRIRGVPHDQALRMSEHALRYGCDDVAVGLWLADRLRAWPVWPVRFTSDIGLAASKGRIAKVEALLSECDENAFEALDAAAISGQAKLIGRLLPRYSDRIDDATVAIAAARGEVEVLKLLLPYHRPGLAVQVAVGAGQDDALDLLLEFGTDVHDRRDLALRLAVAGGRPKAVQMLLRGGADWRELGGKFGAPELRGIFAQHGADVTSEML